MARQLVTYQQQLDSLEPSHDDCPAPCKREQDKERTVDLPDFCDDCEVRTQFEFLRDATEREIAAHFPDGCAWDFEALRADVVRVSKIEASAGDAGYPPGCDALTAAGIDILRREVRRPERIARWESAQRAAARATR
ncbi:MAG: hypothetical protein WCD76_13345 [Pyrinomonadaceae bacterium]